MTVRNPIIYKKSVQPPQAEGWVRPSQWLPIPDIATGEEVVYILYAVRNIKEGNHVAFSCTGNYTVDWGDGTVENFASNTNAQHSFFFETLDSSTMYVDYRQSLIKITPQTGQHLTKVNLQKQHPKNYSIRGNNAIDIVMNIPNVSGSGNLGIGYGSTQSVIVLDEIQRVWIKEIGIVTDMYGMFSNCFSLQSVPLFDTSGVTNMQYMFSNCFSLQSVPLFDTSGVTNMYQMFSNCVSLQVCNLKNQNISFDISQTNIRGLDLNELAMYVKDMTGDETSPTVTIRAGQAEGADLFMWQTKNWNVTQI